VSGVGQNNASLATHNTLKLRSQASTLVELNKHEQLDAIFEHARDFKLPVVPLGEGSNVVLGEHIEALVLIVNTQGITLLDTPDNAVYVDVAAGENWHDFVVHCVKQGWHGLENLALIPGKVGAAPIQNIGAYGVEIAPLIARIYLTPLPGSELDKDPNIQRVLQHTDDGNLFIAGGDCQFAYRDSIFKNALRDKVLITSVRFKLGTRFEPVVTYPALRDYLSRQANVSQLDQANLSANDVMNAVVSIRRTKLPDPVELPNAGSFFKNVVLDDEQFDVFIKRHPHAPYYSQPLAGIDQSIQYKIPAAWLIEQRGFKGLYDGNLGMHNQQALVMVNRAAGDTQGDAVIAFAERIKQTVAEWFGVRLEIEPRRYSC
jgi:UDP-N-acetylmuramate dehydrogenase